MAQDVEARGLWVRGRGLGLVGVVLVWGGSSARQGCPQFPAGSGVGPSVGFQRARVPAEAGRRPEAGLASTPSAIDRPTLAPRPPDHHGRDERPHRRGPGRPAALRGHGRAPRRLPVVQGRQAVSARPRGRRVSWGGEAPLGGPGGGRAGDRTPGSRLPPPESLRPAPRRLSGGPAEGLKVQTERTRSMLLFANVSARHYGNYTCRAANRLGASSASMRLLRASRRVGGAWVGAWSGARPGRVGVALGSRAGP